MRIILASSSKQRKNLLEALDLNFETIAPEVDEKSVRDSNLSIRAEKIARLKAETVAAKEAGIVIAADTFVEQDGEVMEKPEGTDESKAMLRKLSSHEAVIYTGFCYIDKQKNIDFSACTTNEVIFRGLSEAEIESYVEKFPVTMWSGSFSPAYPYGLTLFEAITGSPSAFSHGLPMNLLIPLLEESGVEIKPK